MTDGSYVSIPDRTGMEAEFRQNSPLYQYALLVLEHRVRDVLETAGIRPSIKGRVKHFDSLYAKIIRIRMKAHRTGEPPIPVTDVIALRAICPFMGDLDRAERALDGAFRVVELERKGSDRSFREFGYESIHLLVELPPDLVDAGAGLDRPVFEIQLRTILQEAWAEVEHELVYKAEFTPFDEPLKRKLAALNANLSLSDIIFQEILDYQRRLNVELERRRGRFHGKIEEAIDLPPGDMEHGSSAAAGTDVPGASALEVDAPGAGASAEGAPGAGASPEGVSMAGAPGAGASAEGVSMAGAQADDDPGTEVSGESPRGDSYPEPAMTLDDLLLAALEAHNREDYARATDLYTRIIAQSPGTEVSSVVLKHRGMAYFSQSRYAEAIEDFGRSLELDPGCYKAAYYRGVVRSVLQDHAGAIEDFDRALDVHPYHFYSRYRRAMAYFNSGDSTQALADCEAALRLEPTNQMVLRLRDLARSKIRF